MSDQLHPHVNDAIAILEALGMPRAQQNERTALALLAVLDIGPAASWSAASNPLMGITPIMEWAAANYGKQWQPNTRETVRRQSMHQLVAAGICCYNPDNPSRAVNSPNAVYQIEPETLALLRTFGTESWETNLATYLASRETLVQKYARERELNQIPVVTSDGKSFELSPGAHSELIREIVTAFASRFVPGGVLLYVGDTGAKWGYFDRDSLAQLGVVVDSHGKMPDVVIFDPSRNWLVLIESVTSHGPVDGKRHEELTRLFGGSSAGLVFVTAFPDRSVMRAYLGVISWETDVWVASDPSHLIHFNGTRFLGPYGSKS